MSLDRRSFAALCSLPLLSLAVRNAWAQAPATNWPARQVKMVIAYPPGGATDVIGRMIAEKLSQRWGQPVIVENHAGAGTTVGAELVARAPADGYTLFETTSAHTISASLYSRLSYDPIKDFSAITLTATVPLVLVVTPTIQGGNLRDFIAWCKTQPQGVTAASTGNGTAQHLTAELFKAKAGVTAVHVPYKGDAPMITDLLGGQVQMAFATLSAVLPYIKTGKLKAIALAHNKRMSALPDVPTFAEAGMPDFEFATWFGLFAPAGLPQELRARIYRDTAAIVAVPAMTQKLVEMGAEVNNYSPEQFDTFIRAETARWAEAVKLSGARID